MYYVYIKENTGFDSRKLIGEFPNVDDAYDKVDAELARNEDIKYVIEEASGYFDSYGELIKTVVEEN
jgi:hypothetical protein